MPALTSGRWLTLTGAWLHFEVSFMVWLLVGALALVIAEEFHLSPSATGLLVALPLLGGALLRIPIGVWTDRLGAKRVGIWLLAGQLLALLWGWAGVSGQAGLFAMVLLLGTAGASFAVALPLAGQAYPPASRGLAMGIAGSANSGIVLALLIAPRLVDSLGWRGVFGAMAVIVLLTSVVFIALVERDPCRIGEGEGSVPKRLLATMRRSSLYGLCGLYAVTFGGFVGLSSYLPILFKGQYGLSMIEAATVTAMCGLGGSLIRPVGGFLADRVGAVPLLRLLLPGAALLLLSASRLPPVTGMAILCVAIVTIFGCGNGVVFKLVGEQFAGQIGAATGVIGAAGAFGGFLLPLLFGVLTERFGSPQAAFLVLGTVVMMAALAVWHKKSRPAPDLDRVGSFSH